MPSPRFLSPLPSALTQKLSPGWAAKKPELTAGPPHFPPQLCNLSPAHSACLVTSTSALTEDSRAFSQTLTSYLVWICSLVSCGKEEAGGPSWAQL